MENELTYGAGNLANNTKLSFQLDGWPAAAVLICFAFAGLAGFAIYEYRH